MMSDGDIYRSEPPPSPASVSLDDWKARVLSQANDIASNAGDDDDDLLEMNDSDIDDDGGIRPRAIPTGSFVYRTHVEAEHLSSVSFSVANGEFRPAEAVAAGNGHDRGYGSVGDASREIVEPLKKKKSGHRWYLHPNEWYRYVPYYVPVCTWLPLYDWRNSFLSDFVAGATVGVMVIPQSITYAGLAYVPPIYGIYCAFFPLIVYIIMGSSKHLTVGPDVTASILIGNTVLQVVKPLLGDKDPTDQLVQLELFVPVVLTLCMLIGIFMFILGILRFGFLDSILSRPILAGFINAIAVTLISEQSNTLIGLSHVGGSTPLQALIHCLSNIHHGNVLTFLISLFCIIIILTVRYIKQRFPTKVWLQCVPDILLVVVIVTIASSAMDFQSYGVVVLGTMQYGFTTPVFPNLAAEYTDSFLITSALMIAMLGFVESQLVSKKFANKHGYVISANRELVAMGLANILGSIFGAYGAFGSLPRTKVSETAGSKSGMANIIVVLVCLISILVILPYFSTTPRCVTAAIVFCVALSLIETHAVHFTAKVKQWGDLVMMFAMTLVTFVLGVDTGVFFAFGSCLLLSVKQSTLPAVTLLGRGSSDDEFGAMTELERRVKDIEGLLVYKVDGPLYFANAEKLKDSTRRMETYGGFHVHPGEPAKPMAITVIIFDMNSLTTVDASALEIMVEIVESYIHYKRRVCLVGVNSKALAKFQLAGIIRTIGVANLFQTVTQAMDSVKESPPIKVTTTAVIR